MAEDLNRSADADVRSDVLNEVGRAMGTFSMLRPGDRVAVGVSGGKDSLCLIHALEAWRVRAPFPYEVVAVTVDQGKFTAPIAPVGARLGALGIRWICREEPRTLQLVADGIGHGCDVCSRNRRGALYAIAAELGCTVLALGHTADDCAESLLRNILFNGRIASLPPVARSRKGEVRVVRPLAFVTEEATAAYVAAVGMEPLGCVCQEKAGPRQEIREFLESMRARHTDITGSVTSALANVTPYALFDPKLSREGADVPAFRADARSPES